MSSEASFAKIDKGIFVRNYQSKKGCKMPFRRKLGGLRQCFCSRAKVRKWKREIIQPQMS